jgi:hypothetical protein
MQKSFAETSKPSKQASKQASNNNNMMDGQSHSSKIASFLLAWQ